MPKQKYAVESLTVTAAVSWCMTDFLTKVGQPNTPRIRRNMWQRLRAQGIDTSHWDRSPRRWYSDEALARAVASSVSIAATLRTLGVPVTGGQHAHLARRVRQAGIDTTHFLGQAHGRGTRGPRRDPVQVLVVLPPGSDRPRTETLRNAMHGSGVERRCGVCDCEPWWRGAPLILMIDHINGDWLDNRLENLRFLCPNCHSQTSTWCRRTDSRSKA
jgi:hypothetical protein